MYRTNRFVRAADGTHIAYRVDGEGPNLVYVNGFACTDSYWVYLHERFKSRATQLVWDFKGHGNSEAARDIDSVTIPGMVDDMLRVMDDAGIETATLLGFSLGSQIVLEAWRHAPDRIDAIIPMLGPYEYTFNTALPWGLGKGLYQVFKRIGPGQASVSLNVLSKMSRSSVIYALLKLSGMVGGSVPYEDMEPFFEHLGDVDGPTLVQLAIAAQNHSAGDILEDIGVPTLIVTGGRDSLAPPRLGREMERRIPDSELLIVEDATHTGILGHNQLIEDRVERFLDEHGLLATPGRAASSG
jgi:pimeloyl-ACP methyl ester carboxylesterase